jgi:glycosyltransferase involved in cell wall biosynthesis
MEFDIVCVAFPAWEGNYVKSTIQLMSELATKRRVLYVDYQYTWKDVLQAVFKNPFNIPIKRILGLQKRIRTIELYNGATIYVLSTPPVVPINFIKNTWLFNKMLRFNALGQQKSIKKALKALQFNRFVVVNAFNPAYGLGLFDFFVPHRQVYYCYDEIGASVWAKDHGVRLENQYMTQVDAIVVSSEGLKNAKKVVKKPIFTVKNGVTFDLFYRAFVPVSQKKTPKIIGYIGTLDQRIDYSIFEKLAQQYSEAIIMIVGRVLDDIPEVKEKTDPLRQYPNIQFEGTKPPELLMEYLKIFHIGIIPFLKTEQTAAIYPMKINEYLAAGLGVVATDFAPLTEFESVIAIAHNTETFVEKVGLLLNTDADTNQPARIAMAKSNDWSQRGVQLDTILDKVVSTNPES